MQATVSGFDPRTWSGTVLLDDGVELSFAEPAMRGSGLRLLRPGQRVRLEVSGDDAALVVQRIQVITLA
jgi:cold shock CspA family protein